ALFVGGVAAVLLELAEPRVRTGVWHATGFRTDPARRLRSTGLAAMVTVYGPRSKAEGMIAAINRRHATIHGVTPGGVAFRADEPQLLDWVHATASYGFLEAFHAYVRPLDAAQRDRFYAEGRASALLYGAAGAPASQHQFEQMMQSMRGMLEPSPIVFEFLGIMRRAPCCPARCAWPRAC
ncbi:MAG TPA: oxygenase MpaB family protein, partial [Noviherbaspirillum sp.]